MIAVIIAGGSGTRLWPLSTPDHPKHLLSLTNERSLLQNTYSRAKLVADKIFVVSETSHIEEVYAQLRELSRDHIIVEPGRRGTASCVLAALAKIRQLYDKSEPIVFMHADHHIRDTRGFVDTVNRAGDASSVSGKLVLLGVEPTHAATGFGYIERGDSINGVQPVYTVKSFKEKPDHTTAEKYLATGRYLWNMGYFVAPLEVFEAAIEHYAPDLWSNYQKLLTAESDDEMAERYLGFANEPIDIALNEKLADLLVTPGTFDWMDVGAYPDVHQVSPQDDAGNTIQGLVEIEGVTNSLIRNDGDVPIAVIGLDNIAVICSPNGILVTNKGHAQKVGDVAKRLDTRRQQ